MKHSKSYGRRAFLGGAGACIALPFLETLAPRRALGQVGVAPKRFIGWFLPNGMDMAQWMPEGVGTTFQFGPLMGPMGYVFDDAFAPFPVAEDGPGLDQVREHVLIVSGLGNTRGGGGDHGGGIGAFMTNRTTPPGGAASMGGPSLDWLISEKIGKDTRRQSFIIGGQKAFGPGANCDLNYSCAVGGNITFDGEGNNLPRFDDYGQAFDYLFAGQTTDTDPAGDAALALMRLRNASVLDLVNEEANSLIPTLSYLDRPRLEEYINAVREVETQIMKLGTAPADSCGTVMRPPEFDVPLSERDYNDDAGQDLLIARTVNDLIALAVQCDATRVASMMWGTTASNRNYGFIGAEGGHHNISHHGGNGENIAKLRRIAYWEYRRLAELALRLKGMTDIDGRTVLDNTLIFQASDISDGDSHSHDNMPVVLIGGGAGLKTGQHVQADGNFGNLFVSLAQAYGLTEVTEFGEGGNGPLGGLV